MENFHNHNDFLEQKSLKDDFDILEYLRNNKHKVQNNENYQRFLNQLLFDKKLKQDKINQLNQRLQERKQGIKNEKYDNQELMDDFSIRFHHELEVQGDLEREVEQCKKSIRLLRGDIGHIVKRNQSQKMLSSKITKVNIIALDQSKKVSNQFFKQKDEVKELKAMRQIFVKRLKNVSRIEKNGLKKTQQSFLQLLRKHRQVQSRLSQIEKNGSMIQEYSQMKRKTQSTNQTTVYRIEFIKQLANLTQSQQSLFVIENFNKCSKQVLSSKVNTIQKQGINILQKIGRTYNQQSLLTNDDQMQICIKQIASVYQTLNANIASLSLAYNNELKKIQALKQNIRQLNIDEQQQDDDVEIMSVKDIKERVLQQNTIKHLKSLYSFLNFFSSNKQNNRSFLKQLIKYLNKSQKQRDDDNFFNEWTNKIANVMREIKEIDIQDTTGQFSKYPKQYTSKFKLDRTLDETVDTPFVGQRRSQGREYSTDSFILKQRFSEDCNFKQNFSNFRKNRIGTTKQSISKSMSIQNSFDSNKAKRIKFLQTIDQDYYRMLKETIKMQKQYMGSNYKFMRRFKVDKYVKRDNITRQKQFESTFSVLWSSKQAHSSSISQHKKSRPVKSFHNNTIMKTLPLDKSMKIKSNSFIHYNITQH